MKEKVQQQQHPLNLFIDIDTHLSTSNVTYLDAVLHWCSKNEIEIEYIASMIAANNIAVAKIRCNAEDLNFLRREVRNPL